MESKLNKIIKDLDFAVRADMTRDLNSTHFDTETVLDDVKLLKSKLIKQNETT